MNRTAPRRIAAALAACLALAPLRTPADDARELDDAVARYLTMGASPGAATVDGCAGLERLAAREPANPVYLAYAGACTALAARDAKAPEEQLALVERGIGRVQQALGLLGPADDEAALRGVPRSVETRLVAAELFTALPKFFNLQGAGQAAAAAAMASPAWARTPAPFRARVERVAAARLAAQAARPPAVAPPLAPGLVTAVTASAAEDFRSIDLPGGYTLLDNAWNRGADEGEVTPFLEVFRGTGPSGEVFGWRWSWSPGNATVVAYPEVNLGPKPWDVGEGPLPATGPFPFHPGSRKVTARFDAALDATGSYNLAFELWATRDLAHPIRGLTHEIMIWTAHGGALRPAGERIGALSVGGVRYDAWLRRDHGDASGNAGNRWTYLAFVAERPVLEGSLELSAFLDWAVAQGLMDRSVWITNVELGNEVVGGTGTLVLRKYAVDVR